jgi:beta-glucosidase
MRTCFHETKGMVRACLMTLAIGIGGIACGQTPAVKAQDTQGTPDERAEQMVKQMTLEEKVSLLSGTGFTSRPVERLGIPAFTMSDGPQGVRNGPGNINNACAFPCGSALAATFDVDLATAYGKAIGLEGRARGTHFQLGPGVNICRVPVNGRNFEYFGEDPLLASEIALHWTKACTEQGVSPTIKHYAANNQEQARNSADSVIDERTLHEVYLPAFELPAEQVEGLSVMCSYNRVNGSYASNNDYLLNEVLRKQWGFKGMVMSDWGASHQVTDIAKGLDLEMPTGQNLNMQKIGPALEAGTVRQVDIDNAVRRLLRTAFFLKWLDAGHEQKNASLPQDSDASDKVALDVARAAVVLLKNDRNILPLDRSKTKNIVVLGPNATVGAEAAFGGGGGRGRGGFGPSGGAAVAANIGGGGSGSVQPYAARADNGDYFKGITKVAGSDVKVTYLAMPAPAEGADPTAPRAMPDMAQVKAADAVIVCVGLNRNSESEGRDRAFELPQLQQDLILAAATANPNTIVINNSGAAVGMTKWMDKTPAIIQAWFLGQEGGVAIGDVLFGDVNPSGRLCSTFDKTFEENPAFANYPGVNQAGQNYPTVKYEEGVFYGYRGYEKAGKAPLYPFGYGLSYTTFEWSNMKVERAGAGMKVGLDVKNTGKRAGAEVVQVYVGEQNASVPRPVRELKGFAKVTVNPGETRHVEIALPVRAFSYWNAEKHDWATNANSTFTIEAGGSARDIKLKQIATLK